jgi:excisionase family DNA binding protein
MTVRPAIIADPAPIVRPSARVSRVMELLDVDESTVRRLIDQGEIEAHSIGKRGIRIFLDSVADYQAAKEKPAKSPVDKRNVRAQVSRATHKAAEARLRESGILR